MKKIAVVLTIVAILMMTMPAAAESVAETTLHTKIGEYFFIPQGSGDLTYPANQPFHFAHGWQAAIDGPKIALARVNVRLILDGNEVEKDFIEFYKAENADGIEVLVKRFVFNFPEGLAGSHHIQFYYTNTCAVWQDTTLDPPLICDNPQELFEFLLKDWWIDFQ